MKLYTKMPNILKPFYNEELSLANHHFATDKSLSWHHLERAHIIGQRYPYEHTSVHWKMLKFGLRIKSSNEVIGQIPRLIFGGIKSFVGEIPVGNTGGANVPPLQPMSIPQDIATILNKVK